MTIKYFKYFRKKMMTFMNISHYFYYCSNSKSFFSCYMMTMANHKIKLSSVNFEGCKFHSIGCYCYYRLGYYYAWFYPLRLLMKYINDDTYSSKTTSHVIDAYDLNIINNGSFILLHCYKSFLLYYYAIILYSLGVVISISLSSLITLKAVDEMVMVFVG